MIFKKSNVILSKKSILFLLKSNCILSKKSNLFELSDILEKVFYSYLDTKSNVILSKKKQQKKYGRAIHIIRTILFLD